MRFSNTAIQAAALFLLSTIASASPVEVSEAELDARARKPRPHAAYLRVEGSPNTVYEGKVLFPHQREITTPSGGTHQCNGQNNGANPNPGPTCSTLLAAAAKHAFSPYYAPFPFDGTYDSDFQDYFITSIGGTTETSTEFWGLLYGTSGAPLGFTPTGGCESEIAPGSTTLWAFNAFNVVGFLELTAPDGAEATVGQPFTLFVGSNGGDGSAYSATSGIPVNEFDPNTGLPVSGGATQTSDGNGNVQFTPTEAGTFFYKADGGNYIRSNAVKIVVSNA